MSITFKLGTEQLLEPQHIGSVVMIDAFVRKGISPTATLTTSLSFCGTLAGFTESRGDTHVPVSEIEEADIGRFPDYEVTIFFVDGRSLRIGERDAATVTVYDGSDS